MVSFIPSSTDFGRVIERLFVISTSKHLLISILTQLGVDVITFHACSYRCAENYIDFVYLRILNAKTVENTNWFRIWAIQKPDHIC